MSPRDGWGVACYDAENIDLALFREPRAAADSALARSLQREGPVTRLAISHIRHATQGATGTLSNTQPFTRELGGRMHAFAHNGHLLGIDDSPLGARTRFQRLGDTDSEAAFCALLERLQQAFGNQAAAAPLQERLALVAEFAAELRRLGPANFLYADGQALFVHGHRRTQRPGLIAPPGLHLLTRRCSGEHEGLRLSGVQIDCGFQQVTLAASLPLSDEAWQPMAEGEVAAIVDGEVRACITP
jgi:predicted glutamine amidotransferase